MCLSGVQPLGGAIEGPKAPTLTGMGEQEASPGPGRLDGRVDGETDRKVTVPKIQGLGLLEPGLPFPFPAPSTPTRSHEGSELPQPSGSQPQQLRPCWPHAGAKDMLRDIVPVLWRR